MRFQIQCFASCKDFCVALCQRRTSCNAKSPQRFRTGENEAVGLQRIGSALDRILTTLVLMSVWRVFPHLPR